MAENKIDKSNEPEGKGIDESPVPGVVSVTMETPANADKTSNPVDNDAKGNQPPVRTNRPDVPIAQVMGAGAGAHEPNDDEHIGADGRFYANPKDAPKPDEALVGQEPAKK